VTKRVEPRLYLSPVSVKRQLHENMKNDNPKVCLDYKKQAVFSQLNNVTKHIFDG
jgi:hypothetical protein